MCAFLRRQGGVFAFVLLGWLGGDPGSVRAAGFDPCAETLQILHSTEFDLVTGNPVYRQAPTLVPGRDRTLALDLVMKRASLFIGRYPVEGVPTLAVTPRRGQGSQAFILDRRTGRNVPVPAECLSRPELAYGGARWKLEQGDRIDILFRSALDFTESTLSPPNTTKGAPCNAGNLHTHGLLVSPRRGNADTGATYGDYVFDVTMPESSRGSPVDTCRSSSTAAVPPPPAGAGGGQTRLPREAPFFAPYAPLAPRATPSPFAPVFPQAARAEARAEPKAAELKAHAGHLTSINPLHYVIDIPAGRFQPGDWRHNPLASGRHPSGLMWYHTHPHGYARAQLNGGTSGFISIGGVCDNLKYDGQSCREESWNLRYIGLKDVQIEKRESSFGGQPRYAFARTYDPKFCAESAASALKKKTPLPGECDGAGPNPGKWLFTLNGMIHPTIESVPGKIEVWLLANTSPNVSYRLQLARASDGALQQVKVLAVDGVAADDYLTDTVFMMPGSRAEIMISLDRGRYIFRQAGFDTGQDVWPTIDLATVVIKDRPPLRRHWSRNLGGLWQRGFDRVHNLFPPEESEPLPPVQAPAGAREACAREGVRHVHFVWQARDDVNPLSKEFFGLLAGVQGPGDVHPVFFDAEGKAVRKNVREIYDEYNRKQIDGATGKEKLVHPDGVAFGSQPFGGVCTMKGREETWVVYNWTPEVHNLHLHQTRFRIVPPRTASLHTRFDLEQLQQQGLGTESLGRAREANRNLDFIERLLTPTGQGRGFAEAYHDSIPVNKGVPIGAAGACDGSPDNPGCSPGKITLKVRFDRDEQVGAMVYHCHILEHEDNGMMGVLRVCDPSRSRNAPDADPECFASN